MPLRHGYIPRADASQQGAAMYGTSKPLVSMSRTAVETGGAKQPFTWLALSLLRTARTRSKPLICSVVPLRTFAAAKSPPDQ